MYEKGCMMVRLQASSFAFLKVKADVDFQEQAQNCLHTLGIPGFAPSMAVIQASP